MPAAKFALATKHCSTCQHYTFKEREEDDDAPGCVYCLHHQRWLDYHKFKPDAKLSCDEWRMKEHSNEGVHYDQ